MPSIVHGSIVLGMLFFCSRSIATKANNCVLIGCTYIAIYNRL